MQQSHDQLDIYLRDMANGIMVQDKNGKLIYANYEAAKMMGFVSAEAMLNATRDELLEPFELYDEFGEPFPPSSLPGRLALLGMRYPETILQWRFKDNGRKRWAFDKARPLFNEKGEVIASISLFLDITELKEAQQALSDQREQYRVTLRSIGDAVIATNAQGCVTFMNPVAAVLTGWSEEAVLDQPCATIFHAVDEKTRKPVANLAERVLREGSIVETGNSLILVAKDGTERPIGVRASPISDVQNHPMGMVLVFWDMTEQRAAERSLKAKARQQEVIAALGLRALEGIDLPSLMQEAAEQLAQTLQVDYTKVLELLPGGDSFVLRAGAGWNDTVIAGRTKVDAGNDSQAGFALQTSEPVIVEDLHLETRFNPAPLLINHQVVSGMSVIIGEVKHPWGVLGAHTRQKRLFTIDDINFLQAIANLLALSINRERVERAEREERIFAEALRDTAEALSGTLDLAMVLDRILENLERVVPHEAGDIMLIEDDIARIVRYRGYAEGGAAATLPDVRLPLKGTTSLNTMLRTRQPLLVSDTHEYPGWLKLTRMEWLRSYMAAPLIIQGKVCGFLNVSSHEPNFFTQAQADRLQSFAAQASVAIRNAQLYDEALKIADEHAIGQVVQELRRGLR
jgi:PAS domain S-box-containing protein